MKDLKLKKVFALLLASSMCVSMAACGSTGADESTGSDSTASEAPAVRTDETRFEEIRTAVAATEAYTGDLTMDAEMEQESVSPNWQTGAPTLSSTKMSGRASYASAEKIYYSNTDSEDVYGEETSKEKEIAKLFYQDGVAYVYDKSASTPADEYSDYESYTKVLPRNIDDRISELTYGVPYMLEMVLGNTFLADSYVELTSAYTTVYTAVLANTINGAKADEEDSFNAEEGDQMLIAPNVTIADGENGAVTLTIKTTMTATDISADGSSMKMDTEIIRSVSAKDGKVSSLSIAYNMTMSSSYIMEESAEPTVSTQSMKMDMTYDFTYSFDKTGYDAVAVTLPAAEEISVETENYNRDITVVLGNIENDFYVSSYAETPSAADALSYIPSNIESNYSSGDWSTGEYVETKPLTVQGLYTDKELTKALDASAVTDEEYYALETLYAKYTIDTNYFIINVENETDYQLSKAYQIVFVEGNSYGYSGNNSAYAVADYADGYTLDAEYLGEGYSIEVNGTAVTSETLTVTGGTIYSVVYKKVVTDATISIEDLLGSFMGM